MEKIRGLHTDKIGKLVSVTGTVIRTSEVRPELLYGTFRYEHIRAEVWVTVAEQLFPPLFA